MDPGSRAAGGAVVLAYTAPTDRLDGGIQNSNKRLGEELSVVTPFGIDNA